MALLFLENMWLNRHLQSIRKYQKNGIKTGDICPRCGRAAMDAKNSRMTDIGIYVCPFCNMDMVLSANKENYENWAAISGVEEPADTLQVKKEKLSKVVSKCRPGDHVVDTTSNIPYVIRETLPDGLYAAHVDGVDAEEESVLKEKEIVFDEEIMCPEVFERFSVGDHVQVFKAFGASNAFNSPKNGVITGVSAEAGALTAVLDDKNEQVVLYPDADLFQIVKDTEVPDDSYDASEFNKIELVF